MGLGIFRLRLGSLVFGSFSFSAGLRSTTSSSGLSATATTSVVRLALTKHLISNVIDGRANKLLHVLLLLLLSLSNKVNLAHPEFDIDGGVSKWTRLVKSTDRILAILNFLVQDVGVLEAGSIISLDSQLDRNDLTVGSEQFLDLFLSHT